MLNGNASKVWRTWRFKMLFNILLLAPWINRSIMDHFYAKTKMCWLSFPESFLYIYATHKSSKRTMDVVWTLAFKKIHLNMSSTKWRNFCLGRNVITPNIPNKVGHKTLFVDYRICKRNKNNNKYRQILQRQQRFLSGTEGKGGIVAKLPRYFLKFAETNTLITQSPFNLQRFVCPIMAALRTNT